MARPGGVVTGENQEREINSPRRQEDECVISIIKEKVEAAGQDNAADSWKNVRVHRVPRHLRDVSDDKVYTPQVVSLGPYHHDTASLRQMERHKWRALHRVCDRTSKGVEIYFESMKKHAERARACYEPESVQCTDEQFAEMMLLDGCFILEILQGSPDEFCKLRYDENDPIFSKQRVTQLPIRRDMMMLENQIPLFVLDELLSLQVKASNSRVDVAALAIRFFTQSKDKTTHRTGRSEKSSGDVYHLLDIVRRSQFKTESDPVAGERREETIHCVTRELKDAYIKVKKRMTDWQWKTEFTKQFTACVPENFSRNSATDKKYQEPIHCVTELKDANIKIKQGKPGSIKFENGILHIPPIIIDDDTKTLFCNLIAFEQCDYKNEVTSYVVFLDHLINTAEDVKYLRKHRIIEHWLGSNTEAANLINCLCKDVFFNIEKSTLSQIYKGINDHYRRPWNAWRATLKRRYFNNPWSIISFVAAVFLLIMTAAQAYFALYSYYWPAK